MQDSEIQTGYVTPCGTFAAIPYGSDQYIVIYNGYQVRCCKTLDTAKTFIAKEKKKLK